MSLWRTHQTGLSKTQKASKQNVHMAMQLTAAQIRSRAVLLIMTLSNNSKIRHKNSETYQQVVRRCDKKIYFVYNFFVPFVPLPRLQTQPTADQCWIRLIELVATECGTKNFRKAMNHCQSTKDNWNRKFFARCLVSAQWHWIGDRSCFCVTSSARALFALSIQVTEH